MAPTKVAFWTWFYSLWYGTGTAFGYFAYAVFQHETGNFTSDVFKQAKNVCGMRRATSRPTTATGETFGDIGNYAKYSSYRAAVQDFFLWWQQYFPKMAAIPELYGASSDNIDVSALVTFMKEKGYFEANLEDYLTGVYSWLMRDDGSAGRSRMIKGIILFIVVPTIIIVIAGIIIYFVMESKKKKGGYNGTRKSKY